MSLPHESAAAVHARVLAHLLARIQTAEVCDEPFGHAYVEEAFPADVYAALLASRPPAERYRTGPTDPQGRHLVRTFYPLTVEGVTRFPPDRRPLWRGVAAAMTDPALKRCLFARLAPDLMHRYGVRETEVPALAGHPRPTLYRETEGYELPPHPDTLKKVVTMHLYLPADLSQIGLGTALYRREAGPLARGDRGDGFALVKRFAFKPNSGYAFVVNDSGARQSWHGCEALPAGAGVRHTLLNTFYAEPRPGYSGYVEGDVPRTG